MSQNDGQHTDHDHPEARDLPLLSGGGTQRLESLADGVFSIVMTLLVFEITPPKDRPSEDLAKILIGLWPSFQAFGISVGLVGIYWSAHRSQFQAIRRTDHVLNWLNLLFLAVVSLLPFSTRLIAGYASNPLALAFYGANLTAIGLALLAVWLHATGGRRLVDRDFPDALIRYGVSRCLVGAVGYGLGTALVFVSPMLAVVLFAVVPIPYILPGFQPVWRQACGMTESAAPAGDT